MKFKNEEKLRKKIGCIPLKIKKSKIILIKCDFWIKMFSFRICPKYFVFCVLGTISSVLILVIVSPILFVINSHFYVFISIFSFDIFSIFIILSYKIL